MANYIQLQITFPSEREAKDAAKYLVDSQLAACAQLISSIESRYVWRGEVCVDSEALLLCKTRASLFDRVAAEIAKRHSYDCPQVVGVPLEFVSPSYEAWLDANIVRS